MTHPLARRDEVSLTEVAGEPFVMRRAPSGMRSQTLALCEEAGFEPQIAFDADDLPTVRGLVAAGLGVAVVPALGLPGPDDLRAHPDAAPDRPGRGARGRGRLGHRAPAAALGGVVPALPADRRRGRRSSGERIGTRPADPMEGPLMAPKRKATIIALANQKGGVAKTTSVASLGAAFAEQGRRVLLVDLDPQACLTFSLGVDPDAVESSIHDVLVGGTAARGRRRRL